MSLWERLLDLIYPPRCVGCTQRGVLFCAACGERCQPLTWPGGAQQALGLYSYTSPLKEAIHALKYRGTRGLAGALAGLMRSQLPQDTLSQGYAVAWVPLHRDRQRERGFNQAELLGRQLAALLGLPPAPGLAKLKATTAQVGLERAERLANLRGAFAWQGTAPPPERLLLVDDVLTSGATFACCSEALLAAGAREVRCVALAAARR